MVTICGAAMEEGLVGGLVYCPRKNDPGKMVIAIASSAVMFITNPFV